MRTTTHCRPCGSWGWAAASGQCGDPAGTQHTTQHQTSRQPYVYMFLNMHSTENKGSRVMGCKTCAAVAHSQDRVCCTGLVIVVLVYKMKHLFQHTLSAFSHCPQQRPCCGVCALAATQSDTFLWTPTQVQPQPLDKSTKPNPPGHEQGCLQSQLVQ